MGTYCLIQIFKKCFSNGWVVLLVINAFMLTCNEATMAEDQESISLPFSVKTISGFPHWN